MGSNGQLEAKVKIAYACREIYALPLPSQTNLGRMNWPCRELVKNMRLLRGTRRKGLREDVEHGGQKPFGRHRFCHGNHELLQTLEVVLVYLLEVPSIARTHVDREVQSL